MADRIGQQFGNYKLIRKLGTGGFADVYLGEHIHLGSEAAIKVMRDQLSDADKELFRTEGRNLVRLIHPNIVRLLEFGFENNIPYLVMDYAPNGSLREKCPSGTRLPLTTVVAYVKQAAEALQYAHDRKLIHRDVKPENMLLGHNNEILLSDFGIAVVSHNTKSMRTGDSIGTVSYMAPEQLQKKPRTASDQYALAVVVYSWLTGTFPFTGSPIEVAMQHLTEPVPLLRTIMPALPIEVERVVLKALEKDPEQRYENIRAFAQTLEQVSQQWVTSTVRVNINMRTEHISTLKVPENKVIVDGMKQEHANSVLLSPSKKTKEQWLEEGIKCYTAKRFNEAVYAYNQAIMIERRYADAYNNRGNAYIKLIEYRKALADFDRAIHLNRRYTDALINRGNTYCDIRDYQRAIKDYDRVIALNSHNVDTYFSRGNAYRELREYKKAIADYDCVLAIDPNYFQARSNRDRVFQRLNR